MIHNSSLGIYIERSLSYNDYLYLSIHLCIYLQIKYLFVLSFIILWLGQPLTKKHSYSLITPPTLTGYTEFFRYHSRIYVTYIYEFSDKYVIDE